MRVEGPRFIARPVGRRWGVYDTVRSSWPVSLTIGGKTFTALDNYRTEDEAATAADTLNGLDGVPQ